MCGMVHFVELFCTGCSIPTPGNLRRSSTRELFHCQLGHNRRDCNETPMDETWKVSMPKGRDPSAKI